MFAHGSGNASAKHGTVTPNPLDALVRCDHCMARHQAVCGALDEEQIRKLAQIAHRKTIAAGQTIISEEEPVELFASIISGAVKLTKTLPDAASRSWRCCSRPTFSVAPIARAIHTRGSRHGRGDLHFPQSCLPAGSV